MSLIRSASFAVVAVIAAGLAGGLLGSSALVQESLPPRSAAPALIMLGTGTPVPDASAWGPASAVVAGGRLFLVDAGAGVTRRLAAAGFPRIKQVEAAFLTHLHSDHTLGYPDLIFTTWLMGRRQPLAVCGPPGLRRMTDAILDAWRDDVDVRVTGLERETREWLRVDATEIRPGVVYDRDGVKVTAIPVPHGDGQAFAYRFDLPGRSMTFSGDTAPNPALVKAARGTDILVHEVYNGKRVAPEAQARRRILAAVPARLSHLGRRTGAHRVGGETGTARAEPRAAPGRHRRGDPPEHPRRRLQGPGGDREGPGPLLTGGDARGTVRRILAHNSPVESPGGFERPLDQSQ